MIKQFLKKKSFVSHVNRIKRWSEVIICFTVNGMENETSFDVKNILTKEGTEELETLFNDFCKEQKFRPCDVTVEAVIVIASADSYEKLIKQ